MAFNSQPPRIEYTSSTGQTIFTFLFKVYNNSDLVVYHTLSGEEPNDTADVLELDVDYTVVINGDNGGTVTFTTPTPSEDAVTIIRVLPQVRDYEYQTSGDLLAATLNDDQNYQAYLISDNQSSGERAMILSDSTQGVDNQMPSVAPQEFLRWKQDGTGLENAAAVVQEITEFSDTDFSIVSASNRKLKFSLTALSALRTWTVPDKDIDFGEIYTKSESDALFINNTSEAQTKTGDLTIGETVSVDSWSYDTTTITINTAAIHNLIVGQYFSVSGLVATTFAPNGRWLVATVVDTDTITFTAADTPTGTPTVSSAELKHGTIIVEDALKIKDATLSPTGAAPLFANRAWANLNGTGTVALRANGNISSITDLGTGTYQANFIENMQDADYAPFGNFNRLGTSSSSGSTGQLFFYSYLVSSITFTSVDTAGAAQDSVYITFGISR